MFARQAWTAAAPGVDYSHIVALICIKQESSQLSHAIHSTSCVMMFIVLTSWQQQL